MFFKQFYSLTSLATYLTINLVEFKSLFGFKFIKVAKDVKL